MALLDCIGNEGLKVNYYSSIDYSTAPGEAIFINSNLILTEPAVSALRRWGGFTDGGRVAGGNNTNAHSSLR